MAEVMGRDLRDHGLSKIQASVINYARMMYVFGRDFFSIFKYYTAGISGRNSEYLVGQGSTKRLVAVKPITLDAIKYRGGQVQVDLEFKSIGFTERLIRARQVGAIFSMSHTELGQGPMWAQRVLGGVSKATAIGLGIAIDRNISASLTQRLPIIEVAGPETGTRYITPKYTPTIMKTNWVYRDGPWTNSEEDQFNHESVHKIFGFFLDKKAKTCVLQLTPTARNMLAKTEQGQKLLDAGGIYGNPTSLLFVDTPHDLAAGLFITDNTNVASAYSASTNRITVAARTLGARHTDDDRVLFPLNQNMGDTQLNGLSDVASNAFENIEVQPDNLLGAWDIDSVSFGDFQELNLQQQKRDIRLLNALIILSRFGIGSVVNNENKVMLFPIRGKNL